MIQGSLKSGPPMPGINIGVAASPIIFNNRLVELSQGVLSISADPLIIRNTIMKCMTGIESSTFQGYVSNAKIKLNDISRSTINGIKISGHNNYSIVKKNVRITKNKMAGIKIENEASPKIIENRISNNMCQGILIVESSSAFISGNAIFQNIKANIALGGGRAEQTVIIGNKIFNGASEGIFIMLAGRAVIYNNKIYGNYDGIVSLEAVPDISFNEVFDNLNTGLQFLRGSQVILRDNFVHHNTGIGIILREDSGGDIAGNLCKVNEIDLAIEYTPDKAIVDKILKINRFGDEIRLPKEDACNLI